MPANSTIADILVQSFDDAGAISTLAFDHKSVHEGNCYAVSLEDDDVAQNGTIIIAIKTPPLKIIEIYGEYQAFGGNAKVEFLQGSTIDTDGSAVIPINQNDNSENKSACVVITGPTVTSDGIKKRERIMFSSTTVPAKSTSTIGDVIPRVLKPDTQYVLRMTALEAATDLGAYIRYVEL